MNSCFTTLILGSGSRALFFHSMALASVRFYTLIFSTVLLCLKLNGKMNYIKCTKQKEIPYLWEI